MKTKHILLLLAAAFVLYMLWKNKGTQAGNPQSFVPKNDGTGSGNGINSMPTFIAGNPVGYYNSVPLLPNAANTVQGQTLSFNGITH